MSLTYDIPNRMIQDNDPEFYPAYLQGLEYFIYVNSDELFDDADFANWSIGVFNKSGTEVQNLGSPTKDIISGSDYRFYFTMTLDSSFSGVHFLGIYNSSTNAAVMQFDPFEVITSEEVVDYAMLQYRNSTNLDNFNYAASLFDGKYNTVMLPLNLISWGYEYDIDAYNEYSSGERRTEATARRKVWTLESFMLDQATHDAMASMTIHDEIYINGERVKVKEGHSPQVQRDMKLNNGSIQFYVESFATINYKT